MDLHLTCIGSTLTRVDSDKPEVLVVCLCLICVFGHGFTG